MNFQRLFYYLPFDSLIINVTKRQLNIEEVMPLLLTESHGLSKNGKEMFERVYNQFKSINGNWSNNEIGSFLRKIYSNSYIIVHEENAQKFSRQVTYG